jgi:hypothetical protein
MRDERTENGHADIVRALLAHPDAVIGSGIHARASLARRLMP